MSTQDDSRRLLRIHAQGLQIDAECGERGVIHLTARADQKHKSPWRRFRQHLAHALFRAGRLCDPSNHHGPIRVVELLMPPASLNDEATWFRQCQVFQRWPTQAANGDTHYETLVAHEGVQSHQDRLAALHQFFRGSRQEGADDAHALSPIKTTILRSPGESQ